MVSRFLEAKIAVAMQLLQGLAIERAMRMAAKHMKESQHANQAIYCPLADRKLTNHESRTGEGAACIFLRADFAALPQSQDHSTQPAQATANNESGVKSSEHAR